jgi:ADP-heptose:LPS heptosyltransferase
MAPFSNSALRDWPLDSFRELAARCAGELDASVRLVGTRAQRAAVNTLVRTMPSARVRNLCGATTWDEVGRLIRAADCVVANNSGIAHLAAGLGKPVVCVFAASHSPFEWMPRGPAVTVLVKRTGCAPCGHSDLAQCPYDRRCLTEIAPALVFEAVRGACRPGGQGPNATMASSFSSSPCNPAWNVTRPPGPAAIEALSGK